MDRKKNILNLIISQGILPNFYHPDAATSVQIMKALYSAGIRVLAYINKKENAIDNFLQLRKIADRELPGLKLGVGSIRNQVEATEFINEGANFMICLGATEAVAALADKNDVLWVPGCLTATEVMMADDLGVQLVKLFPGNLLGPAYIRTIREIFPTLLFMPSGGIATTEERLNDWFNNGASAVELGTELISDSLVEARDYPGIESIMVHTLEKMEKIRNR